MTLSVTGLDQSSYFRCRARLHLDPVFAVSDVHCSDKQAISFYESSWQSPAFSAVQLRNALSGDRDWAKQGMLRLCTLAKTWREECSGGRKGKCGWEGNVQVAAICYQKWKSSASQSFSVLSFGNKSIIIFIVELRLSSSHSITSPWQGRVDSSYGAAARTDVLQPCFACKIVHLKATLTSVSWVFQLKKKRNKINTRHANCALKQLL